MAKLATKKAKVISAKSKKVAKPVEPEKRKRGRPEQVSEAVFNAAGDLLHEIPIQSLSFELLAERAGVHKTTLYRRWGKPANLIAEFLNWVSVERVPMPDTGTLEGDIRFLVNRYASYFSSRLGKTINRILIDNQTAATEEIAEWVKIHYEYQYQSYYEVGVRAFERGEVKSIDDFLFACELVIGPMLMRSTLTGSDIDADTQAQLCNVAIDYLSSR